MAGDGLDRNLRAWGRRPERGVLARQDILVGRVRRAGPLYPHAGWREDVCRRSRSFISFDVAVCSMMDEERRVRNANVLLLGEAWQCLYAVLHTTSINAASVVHTALGHNVRGGRIEMVGRRTARTRPAEM